jgi:hypothetical protein
MIQPLKENLKMKKLFAVMLFAIFTLPLMAAEWKDVPVVDVQCSARSKADPDAHTKECAMKCAKSGFGIVTSDGKFLKFDSKGNDAVVEELKKTDKKDHLHVNVKGEQAGDIIKVDSVSLT